VETIGRARVPFGSSSEASWYAGGYGQLGLAWRILPALRLRADVVAVVLATRPSVEVNRQSLGHWGAPSVLASLGVEVVLTK
jgi:hypothetical protein